CVRGAGDYGGSSEYFEFW
nr:immunoglobulin heavy chain junction region [Macaca mulatta]MOW24878.1 immunoglobulin heavy chain junction region [Macaca mulatta]MOW25314.1 immunoglobulin heavy chain junction region [Macaca mulatta]MOW25384.1 immunoglobulin heavy chain junction region [Macaca mulatta]MOW26486.1 immunoglobulin heavy chain junction region [Macaca mulatta]